MKNAFFASQEGFTLIELLVVVLIIGILAAIAVPQYNFAVYKTRFMLAKAWMDKIAAAEQVYFLENGEYTHNLEDLALSLPSHCQFNYDEPGKDPRGFLVCDDRSIPGGQYASSKKWFVGYPVGCPEGTRHLWCALYNIPWDPKQKPYCQPYSDREPGKEMGKRLCQSIGGKNIDGGDKYYF